MRTTIYIAYHRPAPLIESASIRPIQVGRAGASARLDEMIGDDSGDHISGRNGGFCELTALYWAWKNDRDSAAVGLMHYRRLLDLGDRCPQGPVEARPRLLHIPDWCAEAEAWLASEPPCDLVVPRLHQMGETVAANYHKGHAGQDWTHLRQTLAARHPEYLPDFDQVAGQRQLRLGNLLWMRRPLFDRYCAWLFDLLFALAETDLPRDHYSAYQSRYLGFLAERLLTVFVRHLQRTEPALRLREVSILNLSETVLTPWRAASQLPAPDRVQIAFAADRAYLPHAAVMLRSLLDHADPARALDLYFLHDAIAEADLRLLRDVVASRPGAVLHPINTTGLFRNGYRSASRAPSNATYNRFLLFALLPGVPRLIYLDCDMVILRDICGLFDLPMGRAQLAAVPDWIMTRTLSGPTPTADPEVPDLGAYQRDRLGLSPAERARYVNAGVLMFNFAAMEAPTALGAQMTQAAHEGRYLFRDQDILNRVFKDHLMALDARWNVFNAPPAAYARVPAALQAQALAAQRDPWILHYADRGSKPWTGRAQARSELYWQTLIRTPFYGEVLAGLRAPRPPRRPWLRLLGHRVLERAPILRSPVLRLYGWLRRHRPRRG